MLDVLDQFPDKIYPEPNTGCWLCVSSNNQRGYARLSIDGQLVTAHRFSYEMSVGPIPNGLELDHLCRQTCCVNPAHLEPVTPFENMRRANADRERERQFYCTNGHLRDAANIYVTPGGSRKCRECARLGRQRHREPSLPLQANGRRTHVAISEELAREIKYATGTVKEISVRFGVRYNNVHSIRAGRSRKDL
ncbi:MAG: HNH endonuclease signature motif containing protein [Pseudomonadota bacterium]